MVLGDTDSASSYFTETRPWGYTANGVPPHEQDREQQSCKWPELPSHINLRSYPRAFPPFGMVFDRPEHLSYKVREDAYNVTRVLRRPLTTQEWEAITYHNAKYYQTTSYGVVIGSSLGLLRAVSAKKSNRFPFYQPDMKEAKTKTFFETLGPFKGESAALGWHFIRQASYMMVGASIAEAVLRSYASSVNLTGRIRDVRLGDLVQTVRAIGMEEVKARLRGPPGYSTEDRTGGVKTDQWQEILRRGQGASMRLRQRESSPGGKDGFGASTGVTDDQSTFDMGDARQPLGFDSDDASPTAADSPFDTQSSSSSETSWARTRRGSAPVPQPGNPSRPLQGVGGDAWQRVRGEATPVGNGFEGEQREGSTVGDGFSFSSSDQDRQLAKQEAQKEFDERVDRERQGGDFDSQNSARSWRR